MQACISQAHMHRMIVGAGEEQARVHRVPGAAGYHVLVGARAPTVQLEDGLMRGRPARPWLLGAGGLRGVVGHDCSVHAAC